MTTRLAHAVLTIVAALSIASCTDSVAANATITDSAGVRIVTSPGDDVPLPWTFDTVAVLTDSLGEPHLFAGIHPQIVAVASNGHVFVLDNQLLGAMHFDSDMRLVGVMGRQGGGPGELQFPLMMGVKDDTLFAVDVGKQGLVRWTLDGTPQSTIRFEGMRMAVAAVGDDYWSTQRVPADSMQVAVLVRGDDTSNPVVRVETPLGPPADFKCVRLSGSTPVYSPTLNWSAAGTRVVANGEARYVVDVFDNGTRTMSLRRDLPSRAPTEEDVRQLYPDGFKVRFGGGGECEAPLSEVMKQFGVAPVLPLVHEVRALDDGTIWVRRAPQGAPNVSFDVFSREGEYLGTTSVNVLKSLPGGDYLVVTHDEESGGVLVHRIRRNSFGNSSGFLGITTTSEK